LKLLQHLITPANNVNMSVVPTTAFAARQQHSSSLDNTYHSVIVRPGALSAGMPPQGPSTSQGTMNVGLIRARGPLGAVVDVPHAEDSESCGVACRAALGTVHVTVPACEK
jgi:hypothetical protein